MRYFSIIILLLAHAVFGQDLLERGKDLFRRAETSDTVQVELYQEAASLLEEYIQTDSLNSEAHYFLGYAYDRISLPTMDYLQVLDMGYLRKAVDHFLRSIKLSPEYKGESWHLSAYSKIISIWGTAALTYILNDKPDSARICFRQLMKNGVISSTYFDYGENLLRSVPQNAIVISDDELETFLVYYLQLMDGMRRDVTLVHAGFLNSPAYVRLVRSKYIMGLYNIGMEMDDEDASKLRPEVMKPRKRVLEIPITVLDKYNVDSRERFPKLEYTFPPKPEERTDTASFVVTPSEQVILDIIHKTKWLRDITFTLTYQGRVRSVFTPYLRAEGLAYRFLPYNTAHLSQSINTELIEVLLSPPPDYFDETANFGMPYDFSSINTDEVVLDRSLYTLIDNYSSLYFDLADSYLLMDNKQQAKRVMIYFDMNLKPGELIRNYSTVYRAALLYERTGELHDFSRLGVIAEKLALNQVKAEPFSYNDAANPYDMLLDYYIKTAQMDKLVKMLQDLVALYPDNADLKEKLAAVQPK